eukprot:TRINITY_DN8817_c0_g1_i2.p1 TRINITY_DN8817_c0_g1~~TRINITY_DN8817_c0_g1_i2.p1  ORF type:complete len:203 (+),score=36.23 TRINITY_DN8817_c0_g1_i2:127-735(+)
MPAVTNAFLRISIGMHGLGKSCAQIPQRLILPLCSSSSSCSGSAGVNAGLVEFVLGKRKATDVAHLVWQEIVKGGDFVIDATCGNGNDTFALSKLVCLDSGKGLVYGMDVQEIAIQNTSFLLDTTLNPKHRQQVKLFELCHSKMETVIPKGIAPSEEYEEVRNFAMKLSSETWVSSEYKMLNRSSGPVLIFLHKRYITSRDS